MLRLHPQLMRHGKLVVAGIEKVDHPQRLPRFLASHLAGIVAAQHLQPGLVVADRGQLAIGGVGRRAVDPVDTHQRVDQL
ncbi:hypothetical protein D3C80_550440 [compost metagenome]